MTMKLTLIRSISMLGLITVFSLPTGAQWEQTGAPTGESIDAMAASDQALFAGTTAGIFRSVNDGEIWNAANTGLPENRSITSLGASGAGEIYAGLYWGGVFRSTDNGSTWTKVDSSLPGDIQVTAFSINDTNIFALTDSGYAYRSTNKGVRWTKVVIDDGIYTFSKRINFIAEYDNHFFAGTNSTGFYLSADNCNRWTEIDFGESPSSFTVTGMGTILATSGDGFFRSTDLGKTWTEVTSGLPKEDYKRNMKSFAVSGSKIYALAAQPDKSVFLSVDDGSSWTEVNAGLPVFSTGWYKTNTIVASKTGTIFAGFFDSGIFRSTDNGTTWTVANKGLLSNLNTLKASNGTLFAGTSSGFNISTDNGKNWSAANKGLSTGRTQSIDVMDVAISGTGELFAGLYYDGVYLSTDTGGTWNAMDDKAPDESPAIMLMCNGDLYFVTYPDGLIRYMKKGLTWNKNYLGFQNETIVSLAVKDSTVFIGTWGKGIIRSRIKGNIITRIDTLLRGVTISDIVVNSKGGIYAGTFYQGIFRSTDNGGNWTQINTGLTSLNINSIAVSDDYIFASAYKAGIFLSPDSGTSWTEWNTGLPNLNTSKITISDSAVYIEVEDQGIWRRSFKEITGVRLAQSCPAASDAPLFTVLSGGPAHPVATIVFDLPLAQRVKMALYDLRGNALAALVDKNFPAGSHRLKLGIPDVAAGCYLIKIDAGKTGYLQTMAVFR
jgi:photosystem II stability/assembly factor-like uncharacterized protein